MNFDFTSAGLLISWCFHSHVAYHEWRGGRAPLLLLISLSIVSVAVGRNRRSVVLTGFGLTFLVCSIGGFRYSPVRGVLYCV